MILALFPTKRFIVTIVLSLIETVRFKITIPYFPHRTGSGSPQKIDTQRGGVLEADYYKSGRWQTWAYHGLRYIIRLIRPHLTTSH